MSDREQAWCHRCLAYRPWGEMCECALPADPPVPDAPPELAALNRENLALRRIVRDAWTACGMSDTDPAEPLDVAIRRIRTERDNALLALHNARNEAADAAWDTEV